MPNPIKWHTQIKPNKMTIIFIHIRASEKIYRYKTKKKVFFNLLMRNKRKHYFRNTTSPFLTPVQDTGLKFSALLRIYDVNVLKRLRDKLRKETCTSQWTIMWWYISATLVRWLCRLVKLLCWLIRYSSTWQKDVVLSDMMSTCLKYMSLYEGHKLSTDTFYKFKRLSNWLFSEKIW